jgi:uncharacterized protein (DUF433 family)
MDKSIVTSSPDVMGGTAVFAGTRVPIETLIDYLKAGESIDDFLDGFPTVSKDQVLSLLARGTELSVKLEDWATGDINR